MGKKLRLLIAILILALSPIMSYKIIKYVEYVSFKYPDYLCQGFILRSDLDAAFIKDGYIHCVWHGKDYKFKIYDED